MAGSHQALKVGIGTSYGGSALGWLRAMASVVMEQINKQPVGEYFDLLPQGVRLFANHKILGYADFNRILEQIRQYSSITIQVQQGRNILHRFIY